jgi:hypothetical protein
MMTISEELQKKTESKWGMHKLIELGLEIEKFPPDFTRWYKLCENLHDDDLDDFYCKSNVRTIFTKWEDGRWHEALKKVSDFLYPLDSDELEAVKKDCPCLVEYANQYNKIEEIREV